MATLVQAGVINGANPSTSVTVALGSNVTAGSRVIVQVRSVAVSTYTSSMVTDSVGTAYTCDVTSTRGFGVYSGVSAGGASTVVFNAPGAAARMGVAAWEFSGTDVFSGQSTNAAGTSSQANSGSITCTSANGVAVGVVLAASIPSGWEADYNTGTVGNGTARQYGAYHLIASSGAEDAITSFTGSVAWVSGVAWYPDAAAGTDEYSGRGVGRGIARGVYR